MDMKRHMLKKKSYSCWCIGERNEVGIKTEVIIIKKKWEIVIKKLIGNGSSYLL
jgi:hypothetical protein